MNTVYRCPDGVYRWTGETPSNGIVSILNKIIMIGVPALCVLTLIANEFDDAFSIILVFVLFLIFLKAVLYIIEKLFIKSKQCMLYELDGAGLNIHEMDGTAVNLNALLARYSKGDTVRFPAAKKSERIARNQIVSVVPGKDSHTVILSGNREVYTIGTAQEVLLLFGAPAAQQPMPQTQPQMRTPVTPVIRQGQPPLRTPVQPQTPVQPVLKTPVTPAVNRAIPQNAVRVPGTVMSQMIRVSAPVTGGLLKIHMPVNNARILAEGIRSLGGRL